MEISRTLRLFAGDPALAAVVAVEDEEEGEEAKDVDEEDLAALVDDMEVALCDKGNWKALL